MLEVRPAATKGFGVFATALIPQGTRIFAEAPLLSITTASNSIVSAAKRLTATQRQSLLGLSLNQSRRSSPLSLVEAAWYSLPRLGRTGENRDIINAFRNNSFAIGNAEGTQSCFLNIARTNHACVPNAQGNFNDAIKRFTVHAIREIASDEEITISYLDDQIALRVARQARLQESHDFACACSICVGDSSITKESEERRAKLQGQLETFASNAEASDDAAAELATMQTLINVYEMEGLAGRELATIYIAAAKAAGGLRHFEEAKRLASRGLALEKDAVGVDSPLYTATASFVRSLAR